MTPSPNACTRRTRPIRALRQRGYDLLQTSLAIAVSIAVLVAGILLFQSIRTNAEVASTVREMTMIKTEVATLLEHGEHDDLEDFSGAHDANYEFFDNYRKYSAISPEILDEYAHSYPADYDSIKLGSEMRLLLATTVVSAAACEKLEAMNPLNSDTQFCQINEGGAAYGAFIDI